MRLAGTIGAGACLEAEKLRVARGDSMQQGGLRWVRYILQENSGG
jgi:hypothetical protein